MSKITALDPAVTVLGSWLVPVVNPSDPTMDPSGTTLSAEITQLRNAMSLGTTNAVVFASVATDAILVTSSGSTRARIDASSLDSFRINGRSATSKVRLEMRISSSADTVAAVESYGVLSFDTSGGVVRLKATFPNGTTKVITNDT